MAVGFLNTIVLALKGECLWGLLKVFIELINRKILMTTTNKRILLLSDIRMRLRACAYIDVILFFRCSYERIEGRFLKLECLVTLYDDLDLTRMSTVFPTGYI